jgi:endonuclease YncB( thermonuclease family)
VDLTYAVFERLFITVNFISDHRRKININDRILQGQILMNSCALPRLRIIQKIIFCLPALFLLLLTSTTVHAETYKVVRVYDGDTITVMMDGQKQSIRLVGIDTPEKSRKKGQPGQPYSQKATKYLAGMVLNKDVSIKSYGKDRYDRILGVVYIGKTNVNLEMVRQGYAEVYRGRPAKGI